MLELGIKLIKIFENGLIYLFENVCLHYILVAKTPSHVYHDFGGFFFF
jgi:hypothetical protein